MAPAKPVIAVFSPSVAPGILNDPVGLVAKPQDGVPLCTIPHQQNAMVYPSLGAYERTRHSTDVSLHEDCIQTNCNRSLINPLSIMLSSSYYLTMDVHKILTCKGTMAD